MSERRYGPDKLTLAELEAQHVKVGPMCVSFMSGGIRHLDRNVDADAFADCHNDKNHDCPGVPRYSGGAMAVLLNALPDLAAHVRELERERTKLLALLKRLDKWGDAWCSAGTCQSCALSGKPLFDEIDAALKEAGHA